MAVFLDTKSKYLETKISAYAKRKKYLETLQILAGLLVVVSLFLFVQQGLGSLYAWGMLSVSSIGIFVSGYYHTQAHKVMKRYERGAQGEMSVLAEISKLSDDFAIFTNVVMPKGGNVDFIVVGKNKGFVLEVKNNYGDIGFDGGRLLVNGKRMPGPDIIQQFANQKRFVKNFILKNINQKVDVDYIIVFSNPDATVHVSTSFVKHFTILHLKDLLKKLNE